MTHDAEERVRAWRAFAATNRPGYDHLGDVSYDAVGYPIGDADLDELLQALADTRDENDRLGTEAATETSQRELFQDALAEVQAERGRLRTELDDTRQQLDEAIDLNRSALKHQELRDERHRAVKAWHEEHKRAEAAEAERDDARQTARALRTYYLTGDASGLASPPAWLTDEPQPKVWPTRQGHDITTSEGD